jgi:hypothetical protein
VLQLKAKLKVRTADDRAGAAVAEVATTPEMLPLPLQKKRGL